MISELSLGDVEVDVTLKDVRCLRVVVSPPDGRVRISAPRRMSPDAIRAFAIGRLDWIRKHEARIRERPTETLGAVTEQERERLVQALVPLVDKWQSLLGVRVERFFVRRMKTRWGSCTPRTRTVRFNAELARKPATALDYIVLHELVHLLEPSHNARFVALMNQLMPDWKNHRKHLNRPR